MWNDITATADDEHVAAVSALARRAEPRCGATVVVAIDGPSGSGKTTLARAVVEALSRADAGSSAPGVVELMHLDHLYPGWDGLAAAPELLTSQVLEPLDEGRPAGYRLWSWVRHDWRGRREVRPAPYLVIEGCGSSVLPAGGYAAVRVFVEADRDERRARGLARDGETYRPQWQRWADQETALFERDATRVRADLVLDTSTV